MPYGMGFPGIGIFNSLDIPKIGMLFALIVVIQTGAFKVKGWHTFLLTLLVLFHFFSAIFSFEIFAIRGLYFHFDVWLYRRVFCHNYRKKH